MANSPWCTKCSLDLISKSCQHNLQGRHPCSCSCLKIKLKKLNMFDLYLVCLYNKATILSVRLKWPQFSFLLLFTRYIVKQLKYILMIEICHTQHVCRCEGLNNQNRYKNKNFEELFLSTKIKSRKSSRNMKFAHKCG